LARRALIVFSSGLAGAALALIGVASFGQAPAGRAVTVSSALIKPDRVAAGGRATLLVTVTIAPGFHVNANRPDDENSIPTVLELDALPKAKGITFGKPVYPDAKSITVGYSPTPIKAYDGTVTISVPVATNAKTAHPGRMAISGRLKYQSCNATSCFPPATAPISAAFTVNGVK
jgi:hypothetical protein